MSQKTASFEATYTTSIDVTGPSKAFEDTYRVKVANSDDHIGIYNWDFTYLNDQFSAIVSDISSSSIVKMQIMFKYFNNNDVIRLSFSKYEGPDPKLASASDVFSSVQSVELATANVLSTNKTAVTVELDDTYFLYYQSLQNIINQESITVAIERHPSLSASVGDVELGGYNLVGGTSEWRSATVTEPVDPPLLIITYEVDVAARPRLNMKFTTSDPTSEQDTPSNSLGLYVATNDVAPSAPIRESINSTQTTIPIDLNAALPTKVGLASVGPEIFQYSSIDSTNYELTNATRGIAPAAFPAGFDSFKSAENIYYLHKDDTNDLHLLFDTRPASSLVQYRCVAIMNSDSADDFNIKNAYIGVAQNLDAKSQLLIGVEVPRWDAISGTAVDGSNNTGDALLVTTVLQGDGYYDGALIKITDLSGNVSYTVADSYVSDGVNGEFIISPSVTGLVAGWSFVIMPAPAQQIANDATAPSEISGRFSGFSEDVSGISVELLDHGTTMQENDLFYVWIKRTLTANTESESDTGAVLIFRFRDA